MFGVVVIIAAVDLVARAANGEALLVQQFADATDQQHFVVLIITAVAAPLHRFQLREFLFPVTQHVRLDAAQFAHFANGEIALRGNRRQGAGVRFMHAVVHASAQAARASGLLLASSTMPFNFWLAWKVTTRRAVIGISSPVLGLRPGRCGLSRSWKLPKPDSLTASPRSSALRISSKKVSTISLASRLFKPTCSNNSSASSALVRVGKSFSACDLALASSIARFRSAVSTDCSSSEFTSFMALRPSWLVSAC